MIWEFVIINVEWFSFISKAIKKEKKIICQKLKILSHLREMIQNS